MNNFFASIYETLLGIYSPNFDVIFQTFFNSNSYTVFGLIFIIVPLTLFFGFYILWKYPYGKLWHWILWLFIVSFITGIITWGISHNEIFLSNNEDLIELLNNQESKYEQYANTLPLKYALWNSLFGAILGSLYSLILKQFSKIQIHLPF